MSDSKSTGLGVVGATQVVFLVNKVTNAGDIAGWSWWWVWSPIWISFLATLAVFILGGIVIGKAIGK
jgi:hypothetical protein